MKITSLEFAVFSAGFIIMAVEMLGFGILAPHFGLALIVTSNLIGIIFLSLATGYYFGGRMADNNPSWEFFSKLFFFSAVYIGIALPLYEFIGSLLRYTFPGVISGSLTATVLLLGPPMFFLGSILPYAIRLQVSSLSGSGKIYSKMYALSSMGSIFGTITGGFFLIPHFAISSSLFLAATFLLLISTIFSPRKDKGIVFISPPPQIPRGLAVRMRGVFKSLPLSLTPRRRAVGFIFLFLAATNFTRLEYNGAASEILRFDGSMAVNFSNLKKIDDVNSQYSRIQIFEGIDEISQRPMRLMRVNKELHSGTFLDSNELVFKYAKFNRLAGHFNPEAKKALLIGGGGYTYANYFLGDTPLFGAEKVWKIDGKYFSNNKTISLPALFSDDSVKREEQRRLIFNDTKGEKDSEEERKNFLEVRNQLPGEEMLVDRALLEETGFPEPEGFVHAHEVSKNGIPGRVISPNYILRKQGNIIGHSDLFRGEINNLKVKLERPSKEGEVLYAMLHRDNGNKRFDPILVDGYEKIEKLDVVEIDPKTTELAERYFHLNVKDPRLRIFHEDGRTFINRVKEKYDIIYVDAFRSFYAVPFQLMTREAAQKIYDILEEKGVMAFNIPSALGGTMGKSFQAAYKTFSSVFPELRVFAVADPDNTQAVQSLIVIGFKSKDSIRDTVNDDVEINEQLKHIWKEKIEPDTSIITDDFTPVDYYINKLINIPTM